MEQPPGLRLRFKIRAMLEEARRKREQAIGYDQYYYWFVKEKTLEELLRELES